MYSIMFAFKLSLLSFLISRIVRDANRIIPTYTFRVNYQGRQYYAPTADDLYIKISRFLNKGYFDKQLIEVLVVDTTSKKLQAVKLYYLHL